MAFPDPLYVTLSNESYLKLTGVKYREKVDVTEIFDARVYRDDPQGLLHASQYVNDPNPLGGTNPQAGTAVYIGMANALDDGAAASATPATYASDLVLKTPPKHLETKHSEYIYRDSPPVVLSCTTVNGSNTVTVPATTGLIVGMEVAGTGIPTGAFILALATATTITLSQPATASATNNLTFTGNRVGGCWLDEWVSESGDVPRFM